MQDAKKPTVAGKRTLMSDFDSSKACFNSRATKLAALMTTGEERGRLWRADELAAIFRHQMSAPMLLDLGGFDQGAALELRTLSQAQGLLLQSFSDLFHHPAPVVELLEMVKNFAKANMGNSQSGLPGEIATVLYYTSIAAALVRLGTRISKLSDADLCQGLRWSLGQTWLDEQTRTLLVQALDRTADGKQKGAV